MALRGPRQLLAVVSCAVIAIGACTSDRTPTGPVVLGESPQDTHDHGKTANVSQDLSVGNFQGTSLPAMAGQPDAELGPWQVFNVADGDFVEHPAAAEARL